MTKVILSFSDLKLLNEHKSFKLKIELVPMSCWWSNVRTNVSKADWDKIRKFVYQKANYKCEICNKKGENHPVECHEVWAYDDIAKIQKLESFMALCPSCHGVKHIGLSQNIGKGRVALEHFISVNMITKEKALDVKKSVFKQWSVRSNLEWKLDIDLLSEFGVLPKFNLSDANRLKKMAIGQDSVTNYTQMSTSIFDGQESIEFSDSFESLELLHGVSYKTAFKLKELGIETLNDLLNYDYSKDHRCNGISEKYFIKIKLSALSVIENRIFSLKAFSFPKSEVIYFDIETDIYSKFIYKKVWSIAVYYDNTIKVFFAENWENEFVILNEFILFLKQFNNPVLVSFSGFYFDKKIIGHALKRHNLDFEYFLNSNHLDLCLIIKEFFILPLKRYSLKDIGVYFGYKFHNYNMNGMQVSTEYENSIRAGYKLSKNIFHYIEDDVKVMNYIVNQLTNLKGDLKPPLNLVPKYRSFSKPHDLGFSTETSKEVSDSVTDHNEMQKFLNAITKRLESDLKTGVFSQDEFLMKRDMLIAQYRLLLK